MIIRDEKIRHIFFELLKYEVKIPVCLNCKKLFDLGFPNTEDGLSDNLICHANNLICVCENYQKIKDIFEQKKDGAIDISDYYRSV